MKRKGKGQDAAPVTEAVVLNSNNTLSKRNNAEVRRLVLDARAPNTRRAYRSDWKDFEGFCLQANLASMPAAPGCVALYLVELRDRGLKLSTIRRRLAAISTAHKMANVDNPARIQLVSDCLKGIAREIGSKQTGKAPVLTADVLSMAKSLPDTLRGARDKAVLLLGFAGAFRRSELTALTVDTIQDAPGGLLVTVSRSKTDQTGEGRVIGIPHGANRETCPVIALRRWLDLAAVSEGPLFREVTRWGRLTGQPMSNRAVARIVKRAAAAVGLDPALYSGHSLRSGLATSAALAGADDRSIMQQTGHKTRTMVDRYVRVARVFENNAAAAVGL